VLFFQYAAWIERPVREMLLVLNEIDDVIGCDVHPSIALRLCPQTSGVGAAGHGLILFGICAIKVPVAEVVWRPLKVHWEA